MKLKYINNKFNYEHKIKLFRNSPVKKIIIISLVASFALTGCSMYNNINNLLVSTSTIENVEVSSENIQSYPEQTPVLDVKESVIESENSNDYLENNEQENIVNEQKTVVIEEEQAIVTEPTEQQEKKLVAITFDDGPSKYTSELVDILNANGVNATFFLIGRNISNYSDAVVKSYQAGNEIGIHTYSHNSFTNMTIDEIQNELNQTRALLDGIDVDYSNIVRPPYGSINETIQDNINTSFILWNVDTRDWESRDKDAVIAELKANITEGSIILFHDVYPSTIEAIREVLPQLTD